MAYGFVQQKEGSTASGVTTQATGNFASGITAGNLIYVAAGAVSGATFNTPTDTLGNTYVLIGTVTEAGTASRLSHWYAKNVTGGTNSVTVTISTAATQLGVYAAEFSGLDTSAPLDIHKETGISSGGSGANVVTTGNTATANAVSTGSLILGFGWDLQGPIENAGTSPIAFTGLTSVWATLAGGTADARAEHARLTTTAVRAATFQDTGFDRHIAVVSVFLEAASGSVSVALSGAASTASLGSLVPSSSVALTQDVGVGSAGTMAPSTTITASGVSASGSAGTVVVGGNVTVALTQVAATVTAGTLLANLQIQVTQDLATGSLGALVPSTTVGLTNDAATGSVGALAPSSPSTVALTGVSATTRVGNLGPSGGDVSGSNLPLVGWLNNMGTYLNRH